MRVLYSISTCLFSSTVTNEMENSCVKNMLTESSHTAILHSGVRTEQNSMKRRYIKKAGGLGCHRMVTFCVERHYDNEHSLSIAITSWAPFL